MLTISQWMYLIGAWNLEEVDEFNQINYDCEDIYNRWIYGC